MLASFFSITCRYFCKNASVLVLGSAPNVGTPFASSNDVFDKMLGCGVDPAPNAVVVRDEARRDDDVLRRLDRAESELVRATDEISKLRTELDEARRDISELRRGTTTTTTTTTTGGEG